VKWPYLLAAILILVLILRSSDTPPARVKKEMCIDANVMSDNFGTQVPCDDEGAPVSALDALAPLEAGGKTSQAGASIDPTGGQSTFITYDKV